MLTLTVRYHYRDRVQLFRPFQVHFLVRTGLTAPFLRDEIYCMIMKQLVDNPFPYSAVLGWILLALVTGSFAPSEMVRASNILICDAGI